MQPPAFSIRQSGPRQAIIRLAGDWTLHSDPPAKEALLAELGAETQTLSFECDELGEWDTRLLILLRTLSVDAGEKGVDLSLEALPPGVQRLMRLSTAVPETATYSTAKPDNLVDRTGRLAIGLAHRGRDLATFSGEILLECFSLFSGKSPFRGRDLFYFIQCCGVESLPIVSLIAVLVGVILSFVGAVQLQMFGAQIYVANLVGLGMVLEMGALMSGVIIAGRIGAAYAAQLGTMQVNEEIDALRTMGISPIGFLVLPRMFALMIMLPLLCIYADIMGIFGGSIIGVTMLDLSLVEYLEQTRKSIYLSQCGQGLLKSAVFGVLIGYAGCLRGMQCGRSALAVGEATTSAVVTSIVLIVVSDSIITFLLYR